MSKKKTLRRNRRTRWDTLTNREAARVGGAKDVSAQTLNKSIVAELLRADPALALHWEFYKREHNLK